MKTFLKKSSQAIFLILAFAPVLCLYFADLSLTKSFFGFPGMSEVVPVIFFALFPTFLLLWSASLEGYQESPLASGVVFLWIISFALLFEMFLLMLSIFSLAILFLFACTLFLFPTIIYLRKKNKKWLEIKASEKAIAKKNATIKAAEQKRELEKILQEFFDKNVSVTDSYEVFELTDYAEKIRVLSIIELPEEIKLILNDFNKIPVSLKPLLFAVVAQRLTEIKNCSVEDLFTE